MQRQTMEEKCRSKDEQWQRQTVRQRKAEILRQKLDSVRKGQIQIFIQRQREGKECGKRQRIKLLQVCSGGGRGCMCGNQLPSLIQATQVLQAQHSHTVYYYTLCVPFTGVCLCMYVQLKYNRPNIIILHFIIPFTGVQLCNSGITVIGRNILILLTKLLVSLVQVHVTYVYTSQVLETKHSYTVRYYLIMAFIGICLHIRAKIGYYFYR